jgi:hypothetical protein
MRKGQTNIFQRWCTVRSRCGSKNQQNATSQGGSKQVLRKIYKRTPSAALGSIPPLDCDIYTEQLHSREPQAPQIIQFTRIYLNNTLDAVWGQMKGARRGTHRQNAPPPRCRAPSYIMDYDRPWCWVYTRHLYDLLVVRIKAWPPSGWALHKATHRANRHQANANRGQSRNDGRRSKNSKLTLMDASANREWKKKVFVYHMYGA